MLRKFHSERAADAVPIILLSMENTASGSNQMTSANHIFMVSPMCAESVEVAAAFERQAIARVWRHGQQKEVVYVWRFVTQGTIEESIVQMHREEISRSSSAGGD